MRPEGEEEIVEPTDEVIASEGEVDEEEDETEDSPVDEDEEEVVV